MKRVIQMQNEEAVPFVLFGTGLLSVLSNEIAGKLRDENFDTDFARCVIMETLSLIACLNVMFGRNSISPFMSSSADWLDGMYSKRSEFLSRQIDLVLQGMTEEQNQN